MGAEIDRDGVAEMELGVGVTEIVRDAEEVLLVVGDGDTEGN
jgi:hypothetical protein